MFQTDHYTCPHCGLVFRAVAGDVFRHDDVRACPHCLARVRIDLPRPPLPLDTAPYGPSLAERVANYLEAGGEIPGRHPYFDGVCLARVDGAFLYGYPGDFYPAFSTGDPTIIRRFVDRVGLIAWLAVQSDDSLNRGEETGLRPGERGITRRTLEAAVGPDPASQGAVPESVE